MTKYGTLFDLFAQLSCPAVWSALIFPKCALTDPSMQDIHGLSKRDYTLMI
jgi:hypothetical protein